MRDLSETIRPRSAALAPVPDIGKVTFDFPAFKGGDSQEQCWGQE